MKTLFLSLALLTTTSAFAQTEVSDYVPGLTEEGITYFLPTTRLHITLTATRRSYQPGEFARYAERYLRIKGVSAEPYDEWVLQDIQVTPYGEADKSKAYSIKLKPKTSAPLVGLAPDGCLLSINTPTAQLPQLSKQGVSRKEDKKINAEDFKTEEILSAGSTAKMAELTAMEIYDIRENRSSLAKGQADFMPKDGEQLRLMMASLDTQEEALLTLFKGNTMEETHTFTFDITPTADMDDVVLFRFSKYLGLVDNDDLAGEPYFISVRDEHSLPDEQKNAKPNKKAESELRYRVPGRAHVSISSNTKTWQDFTLPVAQFGYIETLGGDLFNKKYSTRIQFSPSTGSIVKVDADQQ